MGECIGLLLLALFAALIAFYVCGRSRTAASVVLIFLCIGLVYELVQIACTRKAAYQAQEQPIAFSD